MGEIQSLIFDFDGTIVDTETPSLAAWEYIFTRYGCLLDPVLYAQHLGTPEKSAILYAVLEQAIGEGVDRATLHAERIRFYQAHRHAQRLRPGVRQYLSDAKQLGFTLSIASSSPHAWIREHLVRWDLVEYFDAVACIEDVTRGKPAPDLYHVAASRLGIFPAAALAFEDSPHGASAAKAAGMRCVIVPNGVTASMVFAAGDLRLSSFEEQPLSEVVAHFQGAVVNFATAPRD